MIEIQSCMEVIREASVGRYLGRVTRVVGLTVECRGLKVGMGEMCDIEMPAGPLQAEVVGFRDGATLLMPLDEADGLAPGALVRTTGRTMTVGCSDAMLGRVLDAVGRPIDRGPDLPQGEARALHAKAPAPLDREAIEDMLVTGVSSIDGLLTLGCGQRMGIFAGSGVGKSTLLATMARASSADVNVIALIGERGREVRDFMENALGPEGMKKSIIVAATSDATPLQRFKGAFTAVAIAEYFRDKGNNVMVMMDSITRLAGAMREMGLALGEPPTVKGYPPSFFSTMPRLVERLGRTTRGSITGLLTVLVDADDMNEPVADTMRGLLDGHIVLSRKIASRGQFPAVDVLHSTSRIMDKVTGQEHQAHARAVKQHLGVYEDARDLISMGAYRQGNDAGIDAAVHIHPNIMDLLKQEGASGRSYEETYERMKVIGESTT